MYPISSNAASLQEMGLSALESVQLLGKVEMSGMDTSAAMMGLKTAMKNASKDGKTLNRAFLEWQDTISGAGSDTDKLNASLELFGSRAGAQFYNAAKNGQLSLDSLQSGMEGFRGSVESTFEQTLDPIDNWKTTMNELKLLGADVGGMLGEILGPALKDLRDILHGVVEKWRSLSPETQEAIGKFILFVAAAGPVLSVVGKLTSGFGGLLGKLTGGGSGGGLIGGVTNTVESTKQTLAGVPESVRQIMERSKTPVEGFVDATKSSLAGIPSDVAEKMAEMSATTKSTLDDVSNKFHGLDLSLPKVKLPHFSIQGKFSLNPLSVPHLSIDWYKKAMDNGMILNSPTIFGAAGGKLLGAGEAGPEAVVGAESLRNMIMEAVASQTASLAGLVGDGGDITIPVYIGGNLLDEIVVTAQQRMSLRTASFPAMSTSLQAREMMPSRRDTPPARRMMWNLVP